MAQYNLIGEDIKHPIEDGLRAYKKKKHDIKMAITSNGVEGRFRVLVVIDHFSRMIFFDRINLVSQRLEEAGFTSKQLLRIGPIVPLTEHEAEEMGALFEIMPAN
jgi:hypothetical protein